MMHDAASQRTTRYDTTSHDIGCISGGAYEARRLVPPQNIGPGGTLWNVPPQNFCR